MQINVQRQETVIIDKERKMKKIDLMLIVIGMGLISLIGCSASVGKMDCYTSTNSNGEMQTICH